MSANFSAAPLRPHVAIIARCAFRWNTNLASSALLLKSKLSLCATAPAHAVHDSMRRRLLPVTHRLASRAFSLLIAAEEKGRSQRW
jgi:hypothetical protein